MSKIIKDSYYLITLHQNDFRPINTYRLASLLYLVEAYYMNISNDSYLYSEQYKVDMIRSVH